jgi:hypothetical protein
MLTIREPQIEALSSASVASYIEQTISYLENKYPWWFESVGWKEGARTYILKTMKAGEPLRIRSRGALTTWMELKIQFGEDFERAPDRIWARNILRHPKLTDQIRIDTIQGKFVERTDGRVVKLSE